MTCTTHTSRHATPVSCPLLTASNYTKTSVRRYSIHTDRRTAAELTAARSGLPAPVPGVPGVYHCGWHSEKSFGAASYIITRSSEAGGNIMVDCPRWVTLAGAIDRSRVADYWRCTGDDGVTLVPHTDRGIAWNVLNCCSQSTLQACHCCSEHCCYSARCHGVTAGKLHRP